MAGEAVGNLAEEIVGLRRHRTQEAHTPETFIEGLAFSKEFIAGCPVILLVFAEYLHKIFGKAVKVPDADLLLH